MVELSALREALAEWQAADTEDDRARAASRVALLATPRILVMMFVRLDELESRLRD